MILRSNNAIESELKETALSSWKVVHMEKKQLPDWALKVIKMYEQEEEG